MKLKFTKMHGLGNDFIVFDATRKPLTLAHEQLRKIADRHFGVGCDQILVVEPPRDAETDFYYRIFNADGGEVEQCGNGARCFARFVHDYGLTDKTEIRVGTRAGMIVPRLESDGQITVSMGVPVFEPPRIPFLAEARALVYALDLEGRCIEISALSMGNPHAVQVVADIESAPVVHDGPRLEMHWRFPQRVNAGYMQIIDRRRIRLRVWERGVGETLACGTGACAAVVVGIVRGLLDSEVTVATRGGDLGISWRQQDTPVTMTGAAVSVFEGELEI
jgi:diaminopimelate epimerase